MGTKKLNQEINDGTIISIKTLTLSPSYEKLEYNPEIPSNLIDKNVNVDTTEYAGKNLLNIFGIKISNYPKPLSLIKYLLRFNESINKDDIILDFFSGSATTAHAVMQLNAEDGGNRKYIMVQLPEQTNKNSEAFKAGYKNICEIGKERIRRAGNKLKENNPTLDTGFKVFKIV